jgi:hypothetical protein
VNVVLRRVDVARERERKRQDDGGNCMSRFMNYQDDPV